MTGLFIAAATAYWAVVILLSRPLIGALYGPHYIELSPLIPLVAAASLPWNIACVSSNCATCPAILSFHFGLYCTSSAVCVVIGIPATWKFGLRGALWTIVSVEFGGSSYRIHSSRTQ